MSFLSVAGDPSLKSVEGMMSASASLGLSLLWDTEIGLSHVDKYTYSAEEHIKVCTDVHSCPSTKTKLWLGWCPASNGYPSYRCT